MAEIISPEKLEERCLHRISTLIKYEKNPLLQQQIEEAGKAICSCMKEQSDKTDIIYRVMESATNSLPKFYRARLETKEIKPKIKNIGGENE